MDDVAPASIDSNVCDCAEEEEEEEEEIAWDAAKAAEEEETLAAGVYSFAATSLL